MHITSDLERHKDKDRTIFVYAQNERCQTLVQRVWNKEKGSRKERIRWLEWPFMFVCICMCVCLWSITNGKMRHVLLKKRNNLMSINSRPRNAVQGKGRESIQSFFKQKTIFEVASNYLHSDDSLLIELTLTWKSVRHSGTKTSPQQILSHSKWRWNFKEGIRA